MPITIEIFLLNWALIEIQPLIATPPEMDEEDNSSKYYQAPVG